MFLRLSLLLLINVIAISSACDHISLRRLLNDTIFSTPIARHRIVPFGQSEHLQTLGPILLLCTTVLLLLHYCLIGLSVDVLEGKFGDVDLFLLLLL